MNIVAPEISYWLRQQFIWFEIDIVRKNRPQSRPSLFPIVHKASYPHGVLSSCWQLKMPMPHAQAAQTSRPFAYCRSAGNASGPGNGFDEL
jgi:hypothetical protein